MSELLGFMENVIAVEVLIRGLREIICVEATRILAHLILDHSIVVVVCIAAAYSQVVADEIFGFAWGTVG